jgi:3-oxoacyl-[acyl-carrier-protein] synthase II
MALGGRGYGRPGLGDPDRLGVAGQRTLFPGIVLFMTRRVVITGIGVICPLGMTSQEIWQHLSEGTSGVRALSLVPQDAFPMSFGAEAWGFTGAIEDFGPLDKGLARTIRKNLKVMCREMQLGIAAAQRALADSRLDLDQVDRDRIGCVYGTDYMLTVPQEFTAGIRNCLTAEGRFDFSLWAERGLPAVEPLWLLKYLPNLPASHVSIFNDLRGPNNSLTMREPASNLAVAEACHTIVRGHADIMLAGATGTKIHPARTIHVVTQEEIATGDGDPARFSRPFDLHRRGAVLGEGAAALVLEERERALARGATIWGEVIGYASGAVSDRRANGAYRRAVEQVLRRALARAGVGPSQVGHVHAHGLSTRRSDAEEAQAIAAVFADRPEPVPVVAAKSYFGNLGAAGGLVELITSLMALQQGRLFPTLNYETPDPECPIRVVGEEAAPPGDVLVNVNFSPQGQASAVVVRRPA